MTEHERALLAELQSYDSLEPRGQGTISKGINTQLGNIVGNPDFVAQFNLQIKTGFYDVTGTASILPAALPASLQVSLPVYVFGKSDFEGGFTNANGLLPLSGWTRGSFGVIGKDVALATVTTIIPTAKVGDFVFLFSATVAVNDYSAAIIINCPQVSYGTLLDSISSDIFVLNMIRYRVDATQTDQLQNQLIVVKQTLFGKASNDKVDPNTFITGGTYNQNIADIPIGITIDKNIGILSYINYDVQDFVFIMTAREVRRLKV